MDKLDFTLYKLTGITRQTAIYILQLSNGRHYCGITNCIERRFKQHINGKSKYTSRFLPVKLVWLAWVETRKEAALVEKKIKTAGVSRWLIRNGNVKGVQQNNKSNKITGNIK